MAAEEAQRFISPLRDLQAGALVGRLAAGGVAGGRGVGPACLLAALLVPALLPGAAADLYTDSAGHYSFIFPSNWPPQASSGTDAVFAGAPTGGFSPNIVAQHATEPGAQNTPTWLLGYVQRTFDDVILQLNATQVQAPRTFQTNSGRLAGDYVFERNDSGLVLRQRQVIFISAHHQLAYLLTFTDQASTYATHEPDWSAATHSFAVTGEPPVSPSAALPNWAIPAAMIGVGLGALGLVELRRARSRRRRAAQRQARWAAAQPAVPLTRVAAPGRRLEGEPALAGGPRVAVAPATARPAFEPPPQGDGWLPAAAAASPPTARAAPPTPASPSPKAAAAPPPEATAPAKGASAIRCPKCATRFPGPAARPATVVCPSCGTKGIMK